LKGLAISMRWKYAATTALLFVIFSGSQVNGAMVNRIAAIVNDDVITTNQIERKLAESKEKLGNLSEAEMKQVRFQVLNRLVEETLVDQRIKELKIRVSDAEVDNAIQDVQRSNKLSRAQLEATLLQEGMTFEKYREKLRMELIRFRLVSLEVRKKIMVTEQEVLDYFREHIDEFRQAPFLRLGYLNFSVAVPLDREKVRAQALEIQKQMRAGTGFDEILRSVAGKDHITGGSLGKMNIEELSPVFADAVRNLKEGEVSELLDSPGTLRLLFLEEKNPGEVKNFDQVRYEIEKKLTDQRTEVRFKDWAEKLREGARIEILL
jgi:peptidyl-prolyl cis-trans isomerase SurA